MPRKDRIVAAIALVCLLAVAAALSGYWLSFGILCWLLLVIELLFGFERYSDSRLIRSVAALVFLGYTGVLVGMFLVHDPNAGPNVILGFPAGTALLVYGIWPVGLAPTILVTALFDSHVLPADRVQKLLTEHGSGRESS